MFIQNILDPVTDHSMVIFTDGSAQGNPGPVGSGIVIKKQGLQSSPIKLAEAVTPHGSSYGGELEAIKLGTDFAVKNNGNARNLSIYFDSQSAIQTVMGQHKEILPQYNYQRNKIKLNRVNFLCR